MASDVNHKYLLNSEILVIVHHMIEKRMQETAKRRESAPPIMATGVEFQQKKAEKEKQLCDTITEAESGSSGM